MLQLVVEHRIENLNDIKFLQTDARIDKIAYFFIPY